MYFEKLKLGMTVTCHKTHNQRDELALTDAAEAIVTCRPQNN